MHLPIIFSLLILFSSIPANANDVAAASAASKKNYGVSASTPVGRDVVQWYRLRKSDNVNFAEARQFVDAHPSWPDLYSIRVKAEKALSPNIPRDQILNWFQNHVPVTAKGTDIYLTTLIQSGQTAKALQVLKDWWPQALLTPDEQSQFLSKYGQYLGSQDNERRLRHIILGKHYTASRALASRLGQGYPQLVEAKIALIEDKPNVNQLVAAVPANLRNNEALMLARLQWRRVNDHNEGAIEILNNAPAASELSDPAQWWKERHILARRLMEEQKWGSAYELVRNHKQTTGLPFAQAEFLAGWLALRKVGKPWEGFQHFEKLFNGVETPISRSRGAYWAGLAAETMGHTDVSNQWYQVAAKYQTTFYGQMAAQRINLPFGLLKPTQFQLSADSEKAFRSNPLIRAASILKQADQNYDARQFLNAYIETHKTGLDYKLAADYAHSLGYENTAVSIAKKAETDGYIMPNYLFPVIESAVNAKFPIHPAFSHGVMRQESAFDQYAKSHAGALGLMQLMPPTARETAAKAGLPYSETRLTNDPVYNMTLGSFYMKQMLDRFDGNRTLAIAAYNAGPGRVSQWVREIGDPRDPGVDEVDWIETIPVYETRNYVQRVTEAVNVYAGMLE